MTWTTVSRKAAPATCRDGNPTSIASCPWFTVGGTIRTVSIPIVFMRRRLPGSEAPFHSPGGKGPGRWAVTPERAQTWLNKRKRDLGIRDLLIRGIAYRKPAPNELFVLDFCAQGSGTVVRSRNGTVPALRRPGPGSYPYRAWGGGRPRKGRGRRRRTTP